MVQAPALDRLRDARSGDATAFGALIEPLLYPAYQLAVSMLQDAAEAEDVVQDACLTGWRKLSQLRAETSLRPWFLAIVANRCKRVRRSRWLTVLKQADPLSSLSTPTDEAVTVAVELRDACRNLGRTELAVLTLYYCLDLPLDEVAATLRISREAAKSRLYRAIRKLRPLLEVPEEVD